MELVDNGAALTGRPRSVPAVCPSADGVVFIFALCRQLLPLAGVCGNHFLRVRALRRPSALPTIQSCRSRLGTTPLAAEQCAEADEADVRVRLSLTVGDFRDPQSGSGRRSLGLQCVESGEVGSQRRTNRRSCGSFRVRCGKHAGQPDDIRTYRAIGFMLQNDRMSALVVSWEGGLPSVPQKQRAPRRRRRPRR
jgi:hypothetical protein